MLFYKYQTTTETNINYLKKNLMEINDQEEDISKSEAASIVKQIMNTELELFSKKISGHH